MSIRMAGSEAILEGCWTHPEVTENLHTLENTLLQVEYAGSRQLQINCEQIEAMDSCGLELLYIWMNCAKFRGMEPVLVKIPARLRQAMQCLIGLGSPNQNADMLLAVSHCQ